jgi:hypothetical protein
MQPRIESEVVFDEPVFCVPPWMLDEPECRELLRAQATAGVKLFVMPGLDKPMVPLLEWLSR